MKYELGVISMLFFSVQIAKALPNIVMASNAAPKIETIGMSNQDKIRSNTTNY